jgi:hypothetical protein
MAGLVRMIPLLLHPVAASVALVVSIWPWSALYDRRLSVRMLMTGVVGAALPVVIQVSLGAAASLRPQTVTLAAWSIALLLVLAWVAVGNLLDRRAAILPDLRSTLIAIATFLPVAAVYCVLLLIGDLVPPYGWDSLVYHLTDVFHAARTGSLELFPFPGTVFYFPKVGELYSLWAYLLAGAGDQAWRVTGVALMPFNMLAALAVLVAVEGLGLRFIRRWIVPAMTLTPLVMIQPLSAYVDSVFAAFVLAAFAFAVLAARENRFSHIAFCMLAAGLALGTKLSFIYYCLPVLAVLARSGVVRALLRGSWLRKLGRLLLCVALFMTGGGYWLLRNLFQTGNPLYPTSIRVLGRTLFEGPLSIEPSTVQQSWFVDSAAEWAFYPFLEKFHGVPAYTLENGFGPLFAAGLLVVPIALLIAWHRRQQTLFRALWAVPLTAIPWVMISPYVEPRYIIAICGFGLIALATVCEEAAGRGTAILMRLALTAGIIFSALGGLASATPDLAKAVTNWRQGAWTAERFYVLHYGPTGEMFNWISDNSTAGRTVTFTNASFIAPLFGWHGKNEVVYAPVSDDHRIGDTPRLNSYSAWRRFLQDEDVEWVVVWNPWWKGAGIDRRKGWIESHPDQFQLVRRFAERGSIYQPRFDRTEIAALAAAPRLDLERLDSAAEWTIEYESGARTQLSGDLTAGLVIDFEFLTAGADYLDLRIDLDPWDWSRHINLSFDLEILSPSPAYLLIYLKDRDPREACRYRIDLSGLAEGAKRVSFYLDSPEWQTAGFRLSNVAELHLVLDDVLDGARGSGSLRLSGFHVSGERPTGE